MKLGLFTQLVILVVGNNARDTRKQHIEQRPYRSNFAACNKMMEEQMGKEYWRNRNKENLAKHKADINPYVGYARNIILFIGDGMNIDSVTGGRIEAGRKVAYLNKTGCGEEHVQFIESFPITGLSKTYAVDSQTPDSASTATAIFTGIKSPYLTVGLKGFDKARQISLVVDTTQDADKIDDLSIVRQLKKGRETGFKVGLVTNTRFNHATPASAYAAVNSRQAYGKITEQFNDAVHESIIDVSFSGGRKYKSSINQRMRTSSVYFPDTKKEMKKIPKDYLKGENRLGGNKHVVGLFTRSYMNYADARLPEEPSLPEMATKALELLQNGHDGSGFFLLVEGGNIDKAHHQNWGLRSIREMAEFDQTIEAVFNQLSEQEKKETLIIVTADHGHTFSFGGKDVKRNADLCKEKSKISPAGYYAGPNEGGRDDSDGDEEEGDAAGTITDDTSPSSSPDFFARLRSKNEMKQAAHSGEDVPIYARGPMAHMLSGVHEESYIGQVMKYATCMGDYSKWKTQKSMINYARHCCTEREEKDPSNLYYKKKK